MQNKYPITAGRGDGTDRRASEEIEAETLQDRWALRIGKGHAL
jgi:hypothetical protein